MTCPACQAAIVVPPQTDVPNPPDTPPPWTGHNATTVMPSQRTSGLAVASLVCSLSSLVTCIGWLPGIICGHLAKGRIRRDSSLKGNGIATAGLAIGYLILMLEVGTVSVKLWRFSTAMKQGFQNARQELATNNVIVTRTQSTPASNAGQSMEPAKSESVTANNRPAEPVTSEWTADVGAASFPGHSVSGKLFGMDFSGATATFRNGDLKISAAGGLAVEVLRLGASIDGEGFQVQPTDENRRGPHLHVTWSEGDGNYIVNYNRGYGMKLQFDDSANGKVAGKIYLCLPDNSKSCLAGTFEARIINPK